MCRLSCVSRRSPQRSAHIFAPTSHRKGPGNSGCNVKVQQYPRCRIATFAKGQFGVVLGSYSDSERCKVCRQSRTPRLQVRFFAGPAPVKGRDPVIVRQRHQRCHLLRRKMRPRDGKVDGPHRLYIQSKLMRTSRNGKAGQIAGMAQVELQTMDIWPTVVTIAEGNITRVLVQIRAKDASQSAAACNVAVPVAVENKARRASGFIARQNRRVGINQIPNPYINPYGHEYLPAQRLRP